MNPYRDVALGIELGQRVREAMMTGSDWNEVIGWWVAGQDVCDRWAAKGSAKG